MRIFTMVLFLGLSACSGVEADRERYVAAVDDYCERTVNTCADEQLEFYTDLDDGHGVWDEAFYDSDADCATASADYLECIAAIDCGDYAEWNGGLSEICDAELAAYEACSPF
jgi:hypothetical protein